MPTISQLVRKGRQVALTKSNAPALKTARRNVVSALVYTLLRRRNLTRLCVKLPVFA